MYFGDFATFNHAVSKASRYAFRVTLVDGTVETSSPFPKDAYVAAFEVLTTFHEQRAPFMMWAADRIIAIPYDQIKTVELMVLT